MVKVGKHQNERKKAFGQDLAWKLGAEEEKVVLERNGKPLTLILRADGSSAITKRKRKKIKDLLLYVGIRSLLKMRSAMLQMNWLEHLRPFTPGGRSHSNRGITTNPFNQFSFSPWVSPKELISEKASNDKKPPKESKHKPEMHGSSLPWKMGTGEPKKWRVAKWNKKRKRVKLNCPNFVMFLTETSFHGTFAFQGEGLKA